MARMAISSRSVLRLLYSESSAANWVVSSLVPSVDPVAPLAKPVVSVPL
jgi:hypothetical protein